MATSDDRLRSILQRAPPESGSVTPHLADTEMAEYIAGDLDPEREEAIRTHVAICAECREDLAFSSSVEFEQDEDPPPIRSEIPTRSVARALMRLAAAVTLVFGALLGARQAVIVVTERFKPDILARAEAWTDRTIAVEELGILFAGGPGLRATGLAIGEDSRVGGPDFLEARELAVNVDPAALLSGHVDGRLTAKGIRLRLRRDGGGRWNVETVRRSGESAPLPTSAGTDPRSLPIEPTPGRPAEDPRVHVAAVTVEDGILEIDSAPARPPLRVAGLQAEYRGQRGQPGHLKLTGDTGEGPESLALEGSVGPFERGARPIYDLDDVRLKGVPLQSLPGAPEGIGGRLSFEGSLFGAGRSLARIVAGARGAGWLELCCGEIEQHNLARELLHGIARIGPEDQRPTQWEDQPGLQSILSAASTAYGTLSAAAELDAGTLRLSGFQLDSALLRLDLDATIESGGRVEAEGDAFLAPAVARALVAAEPGLKALVGGTESVQVPIVIRGAWPDLRVQIDTQRLARRLFTPAQDSLLVRLLPPARTRS
jgi:hypothetical protein